MKIVIAVVAAACLLASGYLILEVGTLKGKLRDQEEREAAALAAQAAGPGSAEELAKRAQEVMDLASRVRDLEEKAKAQADGGEGPKAEDPEVLQKHLQSLEGEIAEIRKDLDGVRKARGALDSTADRLLGAVGQEAAPGQEGQGGLSRLMEAAALFRKRPEELTAEEKARREEIAGQLRKRQAEGTVRGFDRSLTTKLSEEQKAGIQQLIEEEAAATEAIRGQDLTEEARTAARNEAKAKADQRASEILSAEQNESWKTYRARSPRDRMMDGFGRGQ